MENYKSMVLHISKRRTMHHAARHVTHRARVISYVMLNVNLCSLDGAFGIAVNMLDKPWRTAAARYDVAEGGVVSLFLLK